MGERKLSPQLRSERTRGRLVRAARRVFTEHGYAGATIDELTRAAGCSKGSYYFHFSSKEDILLVLVDEWAETGLVRLRGADRGRSPETIVLNLLRALLSPIRDGQGDPRLVLEFWSQAERSPRVRRRLSRAYRSWRAVLVQALRRAEETGESRADVAAGMAADLALALHDGLLLRNCLGLSARSSWRAGANALAPLLTGAPSTSRTRSPRARSVRAAS